MHCANRASYACDQSRLCRDVCCRFAQLLSRRKIAQHAAASATRPPNIVIIFIDDLGYADIGPFGATAYKTPHLDRMAGEGRIFTDFHSATAVCSASRVGADDRLLSRTGQHSRRAQLHGAARHQRRRNHARRAVRSARLRHRDLRQVAPGPSPASSCRCSTASTNTSACRIRTTCGRCSPS